MFDKATTDTLVKAALISALGEGKAEKLLDELLNRIINTKVNKNGATEYSTWGGHPSTPMLDYLFEAELKNVMQTCVREIVEEKRDEIKATLRTAIVSEEGMSAAFAQMIADMASNGNFVLNIGFDNKRRDRDE